MGDLDQLRPQPGPQEQFLSSSADIVIYGGAGGSGKSFALLLNSLRHLRSPEYRAVTFRRTRPEITAGGGLWDDAQRVYGHPDLGADLREQALDVTFPSGASVGFRSMQHAKDRFRYQGAQFHDINFDELTHFEERMFTYMWSRARSVSGIKPRIKATTNPDPDSFVRRLISWWIDEETGLAIPERAGVLRWFYRINDKMIWADTADELEALYPDQGAPMSLTFIPGALTDNPALMAADPGYRSRLMALPMVERERLLGGNWNIRAARGNVFRRGWFPVLDMLPAGGIVKRVRAFDKAASEPSSAYPDPDYSASVRMAKLSHRLGGGYIVEHFDQVRKRPQGVDVWQRNLCDGDPAGTEVWCYQDPGQAGKVDQQHTLGVLDGHKVTFVRPNRTGKVVAAGPLSSQAENGRVSLVRAAWNDLFLATLEGFPDAAHDDAVDAAVLSHFGLGGGIAAIDRLRALGGM